jgi:Catalytic domain of bacteriophage endosialidase.
MSEIDNRLDRLESQLDQQQQQIDDQQETIEQQQDTIESQQTTIEEQREEIADMQDDDSTAATEAESTILNRRNTLKAGGLLALLFGSAGTASADSQGQVGTSSDPLDALYTAELHGGVTNDQSLTDLTGNGLTVSSGSLDIESGAVDSAELANDSVTVAGNSVPLGSSTAINYVDLADTGGSFPIPNGDLANDSVTVSAGTGLEGGGSASLGESTTLDVTSDGVGTDELDAGAVAGSNLSGGGGTIDLDTNISANGFTIESTKLGDDSLTLIGSGSPASIKLDATGSIFSTADVLPDTDNTHQLGGSPFRWTEVYAANGVNTTSDARFKQNVVDLSDPLDRLRDIRPVSYEWKDEDDPDTRLGFVAQELDDAVPEAVDRPDDEDAPLGVTYDMVVPVAIGAIQKQQERIEELEAENEQLRERVVGIEEQIDVDVRADRQKVADD